MGTIKTILRKDQLDKEGKAKVYILYRHGKSAAFKLSTGVKINPKYWDDKNAVLSSKCPNYLQYKGLIEDSFKLVSDRVLELQKFSKHSPVSLVRDAVKQHLKEIEEKKLFPELNKVEIIEHKKNGKVIGSEMKWKQHPAPSKAFELYLELHKNTHSESTLQTYRSTLKHLKKYCKTRNQPLEWSLFDEDFYSLWFDYFLHDTKNQYGEIGLVNNTIGKYFRRLKTFLKWALNRGYHTSIAYTSYKSPQETPMIYPLKESQLRTLLSFTDDITNSLAHRRTASLFLFLASTGMRFSDSQRLVITDIHRGTNNSLMYSLIKLKTQKTDSEVTIPLNKYSIREILRNLSIDLMDTKTLYNYLEQKSNVPFEEFRFEGLLFEDIQRIYKSHGKMDYHLTPQITNPEFNKLIKEVAELCGFNDTIKIQSKKGKQIVTKQFKQYEKISSHDCRRTFITLSLELGMRPETVMSITGHTSIKTMYRYNKLTEEAKIKETQEAWKKTIYDHIDEYGKD